MTILPFKCVQFLYPSNATLPAYNAPIRCLLFREIHFHGICKALQEFLQSFHRPVLRLS